MQKIDFKKAAKTWEATANIMAVWVFGSAQHGTIKQNSDLDIAVLFFVPPSLDEIADLRADLQKKLCIEEIDLLVLNKAGVISRFEAISGQRLYCRNQEKTAIFFSLTAREYEDEMAFLQRGLNIHEVPSAK